MIREYLVYIDFLYNHLLFIEVYSLCPSAVVSTIFYPAQSLWFWHANQTGTKWADGPSVCKQTGDINSTMAKIESAEVNRFLETFMKPYVRLVLLPVFNT